MDKRGFPNAPGEWNALPLRTRDYFLVVAGELAAVAGPSSIPKVQCVSTFLPADFALTITVHVLSRNFCGTWYDTMPVLGSKLTGTRPRPLTRICTLPGSIFPMLPRFALIRGNAVCTVSPSAGCVMRSFAPT